MKVQVHAVRKDKNGNVIAHCQVGQMFGDVLATAQVSQPGEYELRSTLKVRDGRIVPMIRVEKQ